MKKKEEIQYWKTMAEMYHAYEEVAVDRYLAAEAELKQRKEIDRVAIEGLTREIVRLAGIVKGLEK